MRSKVRDLASLWADSLPVRYRVGVVVLSLVAFAGALVLVLRYQEMRNQALFQAQPLDSNSTSTQLGAVARLDFVDQLPDTFGGDAALSYLQRSAQAAAVRIDSVKMTEQPATASTLGQVAWQLSAQGSYPALKALLADMLHRYPNLVIKSVVFRRQASGLEASFEWVFLLRPGHQK